MLVLRQWLRIIGFYFSGFSYALILFFSFSVFSWVTGFAALLFQFLFNTCQKALAFFPIFSELKLDVLATHLNLGFAWAWVVVASIFLLLFVFSIIMRVYEFIAEFFSRIGVQVRYRKAKRQELTSQITIGIPFFLKSEKTFPHVSSGMQLITPRYDSNIFVEVESVQLLVIPVEVSSYDQIIGELNKQLPFMSQAREQIKKESWWTKLVKFPSRCNNAFISAASNQVGFYIWHKEWNLDQKACWAYVRSLDENLAVAIIALGHLNSVEKYDQLIEWMLDSACIEKAD